MPKKVITTLIMPTLQKTAIIIPLLKTETKAMGALIIRTATEGTSKTIMIKEIKDSRIIADSITKETMIIIVGSHNTITIV
jgi:hypothetical protein